MTAPVETIQGFDIGEIVELFEFDFSPLGSGAPVLYLTPMTEREGLTRSEAVKPIRVNNQNYTAVPMECRGYDRGDDAIDLGSPGAPATPTIRLGAVIPVVSPWVNSTEQMQGVKVTRRLFLRSSLASFGTDFEDALKFDVHAIDQLVSQTPESIEFRLVSLSVNQGRKIPARLVERNSCARRYRQWTGAAFDYTGATCPYTGTDLFTKADQTTTTNADDNCSQRLAGCILRFPTGTLPISAYPGISKRR